MSDLFAQLGINWPMLLAQAANFAILLVVLTLFVYRPLLRVIEERRKKIELGVEGAAKAAEKIREAEEKKKEMIAAADRTALGIVAEAERNARGREAEILGQADEKGRKIIAEAAQVSEKQRLEEMARVAAEAEKLIKAAIVKTVELSPQQIDDKLIGQALNAIKKEI